MMSFFHAIGRWVITAIEEMGQLLILLVSALVWACRPPWRIRAIIKQMEFVGVHSLFVTVLTGGFTGGVFTLQSFYGFSQFGAESMVGPTVALAMTRELGPVLTSLMVTGRAGSAMAAELGTMRVTEQIDALYVMAANPVKYLVVPRLIASVIMLPILTGISNFVGVVGGYLVGVKLLGINSGLFLGKTTEMVTMGDLGNGLIKAAVFGVILALVGCYKGFFTKGGAEGVGRATTEAVVLSSVMILVSDYMMTAIMF
jgi:phospholipid/cholesterol/gamma-HCH transport system permease protein